MQISIRIKRMYFGTDIKIDNSWFRKYAAQVARLFSIETRGPSQYRGAVLSVKEFLL